MGTGRGGDSDGVETARGAREGDRDRRGRGWYACTVCAHRPVFDTLDVLTVHRAGKKHMGSKLGGLAASGGGCAERASLPSPQGSPAPLLARTRRIARSALLKAAPYSSCCRRTGRTEGGSGPDTARWQRKSLIVGPEPGRSPQPREAPGPGAIPAAAEVSLGPLGAGNPVTSRLSLPPSVHPSVPSAGWIQDHSGKWVKDENAEFDSDEDEPPALLPA
uniref:Sodium channel modifier 1 n=1 Tax=Strix occidentalis caurina TaxID=311401 RepID=A0A8D0FPE9_STROC